MISSEDRILTNQLLIEDLELEEEFTEKSLKDNIQLMKYYRLISQQIDDTLQASVKWIDSPEAKEFFFNEAYYQQEIWESLDEEWDNILSGKYETIDGLLQEIYDYGKAKGYSNIAEHLRYTDTDRLAFAFARNYNYGLIQRLDDDLRGAIKNRLTRAAIEGENPLSLAPKLLKLGVTQLPGSTFTPRQRATMIARTEISRIQNTGILQSYVNEGYTEVKLLTAEDDNVCALCLRYAYEFNKDDKIIFENRGDERVHNIRDLIKGGAYPPFHPHCRCTYLAVWESKGPVPDEPYVVNLTPLDNWDDAFVPDIPNKIPTGYNINHDNSFSDIKITQEQFEKVINHQKKRANAKFEFGNSIDNETGNLIHSKDIRGKKNRVHVPVSYNPYSVIHNHTNDGGFSGGDVYSQLTSKNQEVCYATTPKGIWVMRDTSQARFEKENMGISDNTATELKYQLEGKYREIANESKSKYQESYDNAKTPDEKEKIRQTLNSEVFTNYNNYLLDEFGVGKRRDYLFEIEFVPKERMNDVNF